jgi:predicted ATPase
MKLHKILLNNIKNFHGSNCFEFSDTKGINTISGKNGAGKTTLFQSLVVLQQAYFYELAISSSKIDFPDIAEVKDKIESILKNLFTSEDSSISISLIFDEMELIPEEATLTIINKENVQKSLNWSIFVEEKDREVIERRWNINSPSNLIVYIGSDKHFDESPVLHKNISISKNVGRLQQTFNYALDPYNAFTFIYNRLISEYIRERLIPAKPKQDLFFTMAKVLLSTILPETEISNFSGNYIDNEFVLLGKTANENGTDFYDIRNFSSGEKTLFYILLLINYLDSPGILIIDEPENHFHEELLVQLIRLLEEISTTSNYVKYLLKKMKESDVKVGDSTKDVLSKKYQNYHLGQVFFLTHSKNLIYCTFAHGNNYILSNGLAILQYELYEKELRNIGISSIYEKILFVEGSQDAEYLELFLSRSNIKIKPVGGCREIISTFKKMSKMKNDLHDIRYVFLLDKDCRGEQDIEKIREIDIKLFDDTFIVMDRHEFENYLLDEHIFFAIQNKHHAINAYLPVPDLEVIKKNIKEIADSTKNITLKKEMNTILWNLIDNIKEQVCRKDDPLNSRLEMESYITKNVIPAIDIFEIQKKL